MEFKRAGAVDLFPEDPDDGERAGCPAPLPACLPAAPLLACTLGNGV